MSHKNPLIIIKKKISAEASHADEEGWESTQLVHTIDKFYLLVCTKVVENWFSFKLPSNIGLTFRI